MSRGFAAARGIRYALPTSLDGKQHQRKARGCTLSKKLYAPSPQKRTNIISIATTRLARRRILRVLSAHDIQL